MADDKSNRPEDLLRQMLQERKQPLSLPPARHKRFARRAMRRKKSAQWNAAHVRASQAPEPPTQSHLIPVDRVQSMPRADLCAPTSAERVANNADHTSMEQLVSERERQAAAIHRLRKDAADTKRELRFVKAELRRALEREHKLRNENLRLQSELIEAQAKRAPRDRTASEVLPKSNESGRGRTGSS